VFVVEFRPASLCPPSARLLVDCAVFRGLVFPEAEEGLNIFDAVYLGIERQDVDGGLLEVELVPDHYRVIFAAPRDRLTLIRLAGVREGGERPRARVTIT